LESSDDTIFYPSLKQGETEENLSIYLKIANSSLPDVPLSLDAIVDETVKNLNSTFDNFKLIESKKILLNNNNNEVNRLVYSYKQSGNIIKTMDTGFIKDNNLFLISYVSDFDNYYKYLPTIEKMMKSLEPFTPEIDSKKIIN